MKRNLIPLFLCLTIVVGCESEPKGVSYQPKEPETDSAFFAHLDADNKHFNDSLNADTKNKMDIIFGFMKVRDELNFNKQMYEITGEEKYRNKHNKLIPEYHKLGKRFDSLQRALNIKGK